VGVHRSRYELERVLGRYGATDFAFVEADSEAAIRFAIGGRYVHVGLPLPDSSARHFTHTPSGRPRGPEAHERAYEQALREHWRGLLLAVRGKLQSVESGLSTFDDEFASFLMPHFEEKKQERRKPRAVGWLLGSSHSLAIALVASFLVPASAVGAFALPPTVVGRLAAPFRNALPHELGEPSDRARALALGQSIWAREGTTPSRVLQPSTPAHRAVKPRLPEPEELVNAEVGDLHQSLEPPVSESSANEDDAAPAPSAPPPPETPAVSAPAPEPDVDAGDEGTDPQTPTDVPPPPAESETTTPPEDPPPADTTTEPPAGEPDNGHDSGNHNGGNGNGDEHDNGNHNGAGNGNGKGKFKDH
jgi:hypothetical protein